MNKTTILIAEPFPLIYEGLNHMLISAPHPWTILKAVSLNEIQSLNQGQTVDVVLVNPILVQNNVEVFGKLKSVMESTHWIGVVYGYFTPQLLAQFDGVVQISDQANVIISTIQKLAVAEPQGEGVTQSYLSEREIDVLKLLVTGNSNKEIADKLFISAHTVVSHRKNISQKTGIKSLSGLTIYAVTQNIISIDQF